MPALHVCEHDVHWLPAVLDPHHFCTGFGQLTSGILPRPPPERPHGGEGAVDGPGARLTGLYGTLGAPPLLSGQDVGPPWLHTCYPALSPLRVVLDGCLRFPRRPGSDLDVLYVAKVLGPALDDARALAQSGEVAGLESWSCQASGAERLGPPVHLGEGEHTRLLVTGLVAPEVFARALALSDFAVVTGDRSLVEAIALAVPLAYDAPLHKSRAKAALAALVPAQLGELGRQAFAAELPHCVDPWREPTVYAGLVATLGGLSPRLDLTARLLGRCLLHFGPTDWLAHRYPGLVHACQPAAGGDWIESVGAAFRQLCAALEPDGEDMFGGP